jgi:lipopolysaccharide biosynthesis regulator YciM
MSENKIDTGKVAKKLHKLQKKLNRVDENESWLKRKIKEIREHKLIKMLKTKKNKKYGNG